LRSPSSATSWPTPAWNLFRGDDLPTGLSTDEVAEHLVGAGIELKQVYSERTA
jgi:hypothetical protein